MSAWYLVYTQPNCESRVSFHLCNQGFDTYFPRYRKQRRHARRCEEVQAPLFPRYLFVRMDSGTQNWQTINYTRGVQNLICQNGAPISVPEGTVDEIRAREDDSGMIKMRPVELKKGQRFTIKHGPFENLIGIFEEMIDGQRLVLLLQLLGREIRVNAPVQSLV